MSAATAVDATPKKGSKKLILILAIAGLMLAVAGAGAVFWAKQRAAAAAAAEEEGDEAETPHATQVRKHDPKHVPTFLPLEPFVVNLADREQERYAQIGVTLEVDDPKVADELKAYMPAIRNGVLMILAHKNSAELLERAGKEKLAAEIMRESVRPLGIEIETEDEATAESHDDKPAKKKKRKAEVHNPVQHVHFSSFIIQ